MLQVFEMAWRGVRRVVGGVEPRAEVPALPVGHTCVVTGASSGIGAETALALAAAGATVVLVGRHPERLERVVARLRATAGHDRITSLRADFARLDEVRGLAEELRSRVERLDVLVNNAGVWSLAHRLTAEGFEQSLGVNHLAPFLLTRLLQERLEASAGRVVTVSSRLHHRAGGVGIDDPAWSRRRYRSLVAYAESKLANVLFANALARRLERATSTSLHPGDIATDVTRDSRLLSAGMRLIRPTLLTPEEGAQTTLHAAAATATAGRTGVYFDACAERPPSRLARDVALQEAVWAWSERAVGLS